ncbi:tetratricopeptide repeat protein [Candidatus Acetothermia bacterium]|nr:tetratricopeptide repeat protein [Candidatus Acetothermia bacterium]
MFCKQDRANRATTSAKKLRAWTIAPRERWKEKYLSALMRLAEAHTRLGHLPSAIECCDKVLEKEPWNENVIRQKMLYLYHMGNQPKALDTFKTCVEALKKHLGVEPTLETLQLHDQILKHQVPPLPRAIPNNLPQQLTSFIGRGREMGEIRRLITDVEAHHAAPLQRLVTLTGVGGCGKTRLGLQIASHLLKEYADGVWWVELASLTDPNLVVQAIASALGVKEQAGRQLLATVADYLHAKQVLLVLDNCEHLIEACAKVVQELLKACPKLQMLVTSREPLGILGETVWQVPPLSVPDTPSLPSVGAELVSALQKYESVSLFVERARANESKFRLSEENAQAIAQVCSQLDGIPLAIELAAARVRALSVEQIAARLDDRFHLLTGGNRAALPRHQTLQATMDWSYQLLSEKEQALLRRLSVFAGGWTLEAAEAVCADELIQSQEVLKLLMHLVDKSLVLVEKRGEALRYKLLETVRQYGAEKLKEAGETECMQSRHLDFYLKLAEEAEPELTGPKQKEYLDLLEQEHDNLRVTIAWAQEGEQLKKGLRLAGALGRFWLVRGYWMEGQKMLSQVLEREVILSIELKAKAYEWAGILMYEQGGYEIAKQLLNQSLDMHQKMGEQSDIAHILNSLGMIAHRQGDYIVAHNFYGQSLAIMQKLGDKRGIAQSLVNLGNVVELQGDYTTAKKLYQQGLAICQELGFKRGISASLNNLGNIADEQNDYVAAHSFYEQSLVIKREIGEKNGIAISLNNLGVVAEKQRDYAMAQSFYEHSLLIRRELGDKRGIALSLHNLGVVARKQSKHKSAQSLLKQGLVIRREIGDKYNSIISLENLAQLACTQKQTEWAVQLFGAAEALREALGSPLSAADRAEYDLVIASLHTTLGDETFAKAWAEGRAMTLDQAIAYALGESEKSESHSTMNPVSSQDS